MSAQEPFAAPVPAPPPRALQSLADGFRLAHRHFLKLFPLALLADWTFESGITLCTGGGPSALYRMLARSSAAAARNAAGRPVLLSAVVVSLDAFLPVLIATAFIARAVRSIDHGRPARPLQSLASGLRRLHVAVATAAAFSVVPIAATWLSYNLMAGGSSQNSLDRALAVLLLMGLALLLVAAIIARFLVATPAAVLERRGLIGAWRRSEQLVEGSMWRIIGVVFLLGLLWLMVVRGLVDVGAIALADRFAPGLRDGAVTFGALVIAFARSAVEAWFHLVVGVVATLLFDRMRRAKEGPDAEELQRIFA